MTTTSRAPSALATGVRTSPDLTTLVRKLDYLAGTARDFGDEAAERLRVELALPPLDDGLRAALRAWAEEPRAAATSTEASVGRMKAAGAYYLRICCLLLMEDWRDDELGELVQAALDVLDVLDVLSHVARHPNFGQRTACVLFEKLCLREPATVGVALELTTSPLARRVGLAAMLVAPLCLDAQTASASAATLVPAVVDLDDFAAAVLERRGAEHPPGTWNDALARIDEAKRLAEALCGAGQELAQCLMGEWGPPLAELVPVVVELSQCSSAPSPAP